MQNEHKRVLVDLFTIAEKGLPYWPTLRFMLVGLNKDFLGCIVLDISFMNMVFAFYETKKLALAMTETDERFQRYGYDPDNDSIARFVQEKFNIDIEVLFMAIENNNMDLFWRNNERAKEIYLENQV